jgi:hypothetical protein
MEEFNRSWKSIEDDISSIIQSVFELPSKDNQGSRSIRFIDSLLHLSNDGLVKASLDLRMISEYSKRNVKEEPQMAKRKA